LIRIILMNGVRPSEFHQVIAIRADERKRRWLPRTLDEFRHILRSKIKK
jgi:hypothetical protein